MIERSSESMKDKRAHKSFGCVNGAHILVLAIIGISAFGAQAFGVHRQFTKNSKTALLSSVGAPSPASGKNGKKGKKTNSSSSIMPAGVKETLSSLQKRRLDTNKMAAATLDLRAPNFDLEFTTSTKAIAKPVIEPKVGVLLLNLGGPETSEDVEGFLYNLFADPDIIRLPGPLTSLQSLIALWISKRRAPKSIKAYNSIGGGSPILQYSNDQARLITEAIRERHGVEVKSYVGMRYWHPFTEEALEEIQRDGITELVIVPLYPQFSISTSGSSLRILQEEFAKKQEIYGAETGTLRHTVVPSWFERPGYINAMVNLIQKEIDAFSDKQLEEGNNEIHVLFSAHGVPQSYIEAGDPYQEQIIECVRRISERIEVMKVKGGPPSVTSHLSYQSRVGPIEWLRPYTDDVLPELGEKGVKNLVVVPISFVSEHIETLEEIDMEYCELAHENGIVNWRRVPALNTDETFINDMADLVVDALQEPTFTVTEACIANNCEIELDSDSKRAEILRGAGASMEDIDSDMMNELTGISSQVKRQDKEAINAERLNGRLAIFGVLVTILVELFSGKSILHMFDGLL